jgi:hypothetical protein
MWQKHNSQIANFDMASLRVIWVRRRCFPTLAVAYVSLNAEAISRFNELLIEN